jgi:hypothetical protein
MRHALKIVPVLFLVPALMLVASNVRGDLEGSASAHVYVRVNPNVAVVAETPVVDAGTIQTGEFRATVVFRVDANLQSLYLYAAASPLYKGDDPGNDDVDPIPLNLSAGIEIDPANANPMGGDSQVADYTSDVVEVDGFPATTTEMLCFESSQNNHFSQPVSVTVCWNQIDNEQPTGEYSGKVKLWAVLMPDQSPTEP